MDYYKQMIEQVSKLMNEGDYGEAFKLLEEELAMPYIPSDSEPILVDLFNQCRSQLNASKPAKTMNLEDVESLLQGSVDEQFAAVELLRGSNIRKYLDVVSSYLKDSPHYFVACLLIEVMIEQQIQEELLMNKDGLDVRFTPCYVEMPMDSDGVSEAVQIIRDYFEDDNPTFVQMCIEVLVKEAYLRLPFNIDSDESVPLALAISEYVFKAYGESDAFEIFIKDKELSKQRGYDLLLSKHDI